MFFFMGLKKMLPLCLLLFITGSLLAQPAGTSFSEAMQTKKAKLICRYSITPGYIVTADNGAQGMLPEMMTSFAAYVKKNHDIDVTYNYEPFKKDTRITEIFETVNKSGDGVFGLVLVFITDERKKTLTFSEPIFLSPSFLLTANTVGDIASQNEVATRLKGFTAYVNQGNFFEDKFKQLKSQSLPDLKISYFKTYSVANISETIIRDKAMLYVDVSGFLYAMDKKLPFKNHKILQFATPMGVTLAAQNSWKDVFNKFLTSGYLKSTEFKKNVSNNLGYATLNLLKI
jgi:hypothetical protein